MFNSFSKTIGVVVALALLIVLTGCGPSTTTYAVKAYSGEEAVASFEATSYGSGDGRVYANVANGRKHVVGGTFSVRRTDAGAANNTARATKYVAQLYSGGKVVESVNASSYSSGDGKVFLTVSNTAQIIFGGTYVLRNIGANVDGISDSAKYKVTVYSDGVLIGTWHADSYSTGDDKISLTVGGISNALIIGGDYVVEQFR
jgi:hypothetical protein